MSELIAKRYTRALLESVGVQGLSRVCAPLYRIKEAFSVPLFASLVNSPHVESSVVFGVVSDIGGDLDVKISNLLRLLSEKSRISLIPEICKEIDRLIAASKNQYPATLFAQEPLDQAVLGKLENLLSKKLGVTLVLSQQVEKINGVRLVVDALGVEVSFSQERFVHDLKSYILKAF